MGLEWNKSKIDEALFSFKDAGFNFKDNPPFKDFGVDAGKLGPHQLQFLGQQLPTYHDDYVCALNRLVLQVIMIHKWGGVDLFGCAGMAEFLFDVYKGEPRDRGQ